MTGGHGAGAGDVGWAVLGTRPPPSLPTPEELSPLKLLQQADLFGGPAHLEQPLLVPLTNGAATNLNFNESHGEAQEALIERYLSLMGFAPAAPRPMRRSAVTLPSDGTAVSDSRTESPDPDSDAGLSFSRGSATRQQHRTPATALEALGLDRPALSRRAIPEALVGALHRGLAASAAAFFRTCLAEQRRLELLAYGSGPVVPLADRLLAFITGVEPQLAEGSALPDMAELRVAKDTQAALDAITPPRAQPPGPFHHELMHQRQQPPPPPPEEPSAEEPDLSAMMDLDKITSLAMAGNVPGLRALMRSLVDAMEYTRSNLKQRLVAEGERAQRECSRANEAREQVERLRDQVAARNSMLAERGAEVEAACRRATAAEEALVTERAIVSGLRGQLRQLTLDYEAQHRELRATLEAQVTSPSVALPVLQQSATTSTFEGGEDPHAAVHQLGAQLAATRSELALAELSCQQERAVARQLRVMLESVRATVDMHAGRAADAMAEVERLTRLVAASQDLANASTGGLALLEQQLAQEKAAHRRTTERLQAVGWKFEQARTAVVDVRARAAHHLRRLQTALADSNLRAVKAERQLSEVSIELRRATDQLEGTTNSLEALKDRVQRQEEDMEQLRRDAISAKLDSKEVSEKLRDTEVALRTAETKVAVMQEKVTNDAETVIAGKAATERLETLERDHEELETVHTELKEAHDSLTAAHTALTVEMEAAKVRVEELEVKEVQLVELTAKHDELTTAKADLDEQHATLVKAHMNATTELAGMKRHADVLAEQVQEYRRAAEKSQLDLETEKEIRRHVQEELAITAAKRDELEARCIELNGKLEALETRMKGVDEEVERCRRTAELAGYQRAEAFTMRDALTKVRMTLTGDMKEYLTLVEGEVERMERCLEDLRSAMAAVQSRLLDVKQDTVAGTVAELPTVSYDEAQKMCEGVFKVMSHASKLHETQYAMRKSLMDRVEHLEEGLKERLGTATDFWRQVMVLSKNSPQSMVQIVERMTGQTCRDLHLDPANPLSRMVPLGVLAEAGVQLTAQHERAGALRNESDGLKAEADAATKLLEYERQVTAARTSEFQSLIEALSREVHRLKAKAGALEANNVMQQRATAEMQRLLSDAEWKVAKAQEREALVGIKNMVPHGRETKAVQTVFSDLFMLSGGTSAPTQPLPSGRAAHLQHRLEFGEFGADGASMYGTDDGWRLVDDGAADGPASAPQVGAGGVGGGYEPPPSPASLPPLSAISSPMPAWAASPQRGPLVAGLRAAAGVTAAGGPSRPHSNLSRSSSAISPGALQPPPGPASVRSTSPPDAAATSADASAAPRGGDSTQPGSTDGTPGSRALSNNGSKLPPALAALAAAVAAGAAAAAAAAQPPGSQPPPQQRRRHPDEVGRRNSAMSAAPSLHSFHSIGSVASDSGAGPADGNDSDEEGMFVPSPSSSPPAVPRTPSTSVTAAAAAVFAATAGGGGGPPHRTSTAAAGGIAHAATAGGLPNRPATAGAALSLAPTPTHVPRLSSALLHPSRPGSPMLGAPATPSGIPHGWQHSPWDWLPDAAPLTRGAVPYGRQALLEVIADIQYTKGLHDQVAAAAAFPSTSMQQYIGAYFEARHGPRGSSPPAAELALAQLLVSLEAHSALYDVMLFARAAGLQAWSGKGPQRNGINASRPATATSAIVSPHFATPSGTFSRPQTSRTAVNGFSPGSIGAAGAGRALRQGSAARNRSISARNVPPGTPPGQPLLALVPTTARASSSAEGYETLGSPPPSAPSGETVLRLRTGLSPAVTSTPAPGQPAPLTNHPNHHGQQQQRHQSGRPLTRRAPPSPALVGPQPTQSHKPQLRVRPEVLVSELLGQLLSRLGEVLGMEALSQFVSSGRLLGRLRAVDLGQQLREDQHPELHFTVHRVCKALNLPEPPELIVRDSLPYGSDVMLLQVPNVGTNALGVLSASDVDRQPASSAVAAPSAAAGGWRRRAVLVLSPALVQVAAAAALQGEEAAMDADELQALLGAALAPMAMPGGYGWRLDGQAAPTAASGALGGTIGPPATAAGATAGGAAGIPPPTLLSAAEVVTAVNVAALKPRAVVSALPSQLQFQWDRLLAHLRIVAAAAVVASDRGALLTTQAVAPSVRAVFRAAAGVSAQEGTPGAQLGRGEELVLQAQTMLITDEELAEMAAIPMHEVSAMSGEIRQRYALARVALLARWVESSDYRQTLRSAVM